MKDTRDLDEAKTQALAEFESRSGERKTQFDELNGLLQTAKGDLESNLSEIERLQGLIDDPNTSEGDRSTYQGEIEAARSETEGLRDAKNEAQNNVNPVLLAQGQDDYYIKKGAEYVAYENLDKINIALD